jgi:hypothetical protein
LRYSTPEVKCQACGHSVSEDESVIKVSVPKSHDNQAEVEAIPILELNESWMPLPGEYLDVPTSLPRVAWAGVDQRELNEFTPFIATRVRIETTRTFADTTEISSGQSQLILTLPIKGSPVLSWTDETSAASST